MRCNFLVVHNNDNIKFDLLVVKYIISVITNIQMNAILASLKFRAKS